MFSATALNLDDLACPTWGLGEPIVSPYVLTQYVTRGGSLIATPETAAINTFYTMG